jgi:hypothetical protein
MCFEGMNWELRDVPRQGLVAQFKIYYEIQMLNLVKAALSKVECISEEALLATTKIIPSTWFQNGDRECLEVLLERLRSRQLTLPLLIHCHLHYLRL